MQNRCTAANLFSIGAPGQEKLASSCIGIAGLGGVGGIAFELLVRAGVGKIKIADGGFFEESNANRQSLWSRENDGRKKTDVAQEFAKSISSSCRLKKYGEINSKNAAPFSSGCLAVIDATDRAHSRLAVWRGCKKSGAQYIFSSALGEKGMLTAFNPKKQDFEREFGLKGKRYHGFLSCDSQGAAGNPVAGHPAFGRRVAPCDHSLGPVANLVGCLAAQQALNVALGKKTVSFPRVLSADAFSAEPIWQHEF